jgi:predicted nucleic acid-binding protein
MPDLLDTNILSGLRKPRPSASVLAYFAQRPADHRFISTVTVAEVRFGIGLTQDDAKREDLHLWLNKVLLPLFRDQTLEVTAAVLLRLRILLEEGRKAGRTYQLPDLLIAATALEHDLTLVTRNVKDFTKIPALKLLNPWEPQP